MLDTPFRYPEHSPAPATEHDRTDSKIIRERGRLRPVAAPAERGPLPAPVPVPSPARGRYLPIQAKFLFSLGVSAAWTTLSIYLSLPWLRDLATVVGLPVALFAVAGIAILPGMMNAFLVASLLVDRRPRRRPLAGYPGITVLVAAYNEAAAIADTLQSLEQQQYPGPLEVLVIDDGSTDATAAIVERHARPWLRLLRQRRNLGKSAALNRGLAEARHDYIVTVDGDSCLYGHALRHLVERYFSDPASTRAVAGTVLVRNSRRNWVTRTQEWDYFHGISAIKRVQSLYQGTMVAQGAFSMYDRAALRDVGGWHPCVGEDIVLTWALLERGCRVGHAEDALCFTNVPDTLRQFVRQRQRWSRGMMEAFRQHPRVMITPRLSTLFVWWNVLFPAMDLAYTLFFIPGLLLACFGILWIVGPLTLALLPMALLVNYLMYRIGQRNFEAQGLRVRRNFGGFAIYAFAYSLILQPASVAGQVSELLGLRKTWGSK